MRGKRIFIILGITGGVILSAFLIGRVFVYDTNVAHPGLTRLAGELYNQEVGRGLTPAIPLSDQEINWLMQGAIEEDTPLRWMNHFFDPIHNTGFKGGFDSAKVWAVDANNQTMFSKGDQSWQRALYEFQQGNKKQAFIALGHVLHLLEDMTVPAHTRDDAHVGGDPYEQWVKENFKPVSSQPVYFNNLNQYFDYLASYSNRNFYSKDTIFSKIFSKPVLNELIKRSDYLFNRINNQEFEVLFVKRDLQTGVEEFYINKAPILSANFSLLAPKAVGAGAGVIKLFFEEVTKQKVENPTWLWQTNPLGYLQEPIGWIVSQAEPLVDKVKSLVTNFSSWTNKIDFVSELFKEGLAVAQGMPSIVAENTTRVSQEILSVGDSLFSQAANLPSLPDILPLVQPKPPENKPTKPITSPPASSPVPINQSASFSNQKAVQDLLSGFVSTPSLTTPPSPPPVSPAGGLQGGDKMAASPPVTQPIVYGGSSYASFPSAPAPTPTTSESPPPALPAGGSEGGDNAPPPSPPPPPPDIIPPTAPIFIQPSDSLVWTTSATATLASELSADTYKIFFNNAEEIVSSTLWSREVDLAEGENVFELIAEDLAGNTSATSSVKIIRDSTAPLAAIQGTRNKEQGTKIDLVWSGDDKSGIGVASYDLEYQKSEIGSASSSEWLAWQTATTSTQAIFSGETGHQYQFKAMATDQLGNLGEWAMSEIQNIDLPRIVINEIAWAGTKANANDEWLELYNLENYPVDLSGWILTDSGDINIVFPTSTLMAAQGFYLLERTNDDTIKSITADLIYTGSLNNSGENLLLKNQKGRLIDEARAGSGWFAGSLGSDKQSMERKNPLVSGNQFANWQSTPLAPRNGFDAKNNPVNGTPKRPNSPFIYLDGILNVNRTLTADFNPYFLGVYTVASGTILTIGPGVIIKAGTGGTWVGGGNLFVYGKVASQGTAEAPVVFTSYRDSNYAGNTNTWDSAKVAGPGEWEHLIFYPGSRADLQNTKILYGNFRSRENDPKGALIISSAAADLQNVNVSFVRPYSGEAAINLSNASTTISQSSITDNPVGLLINGGAVNINSSLFENNGTGLDVSQGANLIIKNNIFKSNGLKSGGLGPARIYDSVLKEENNQFQNNSLNGFDWGGNLNGEQIIDNAGGWPWVSSYFIVPVGSVLTVKAGSHLKMKTSAIILIQGALQVEGTENQPVIFTSYHDDSDGFDSDGIVQPPNPIGGEWYQLRFDSLATSTLNYLNICYANQRSRTSDPAGSLYIKQTPVMADHLQIKYSRVPDVALHLKNASQVIITNSLFKNDYKMPSSGGAGILIDGGAPVISNSTIDTFNYGILRQNNSSAQLDNVIYLNVDRPLAGN